MHIDVIGILLTGLIVNPRYCFVILLLCFIEMVSTVLLSTVLSSGLTRVVAGGIFSTVYGVDVNNLFMILSPLFFLLLGFGLYGNEKILWLDFINPIAILKKPLPTLLIKTALFRIVVICFINNK